MTNFPSSLQDLDATRGTAGQTLSTPNHITHHTLEDDTLEALQAKVGVNASAVTTSHDYKLSTVTGSNKAETQENKDSTGGYVGLTLFKINFKNALNTITSFFTNANTVSRTYTFQDRDGTIADDTDIASRAPALTADQNYVSDAQLVVIGNTSGTNSGNETATTLGATIGGAGDATPNDTDFVATSLTAAGILKKITWTNVKAFLKTYFDTLYLPLAGGTMTGKTVQAGVTEVAKTYTPATGAQTVTLDCSVNNQHVVTGHASGTAITFAITGATNSQPFIVSILQGGTTVSTITAWFATVRWAGGTAPTLTATLNKRDTFGFIRTGADTYDGFVIGQNA